MITTTVKLSELKPSPDNVREYQSTEIEGLKQSITNVGLLQSLLVKPNGKGYHVIAGGRRLAALKALKYKNDIPVQIIEDDVDLTEVSLSENLYRQDLTGPQIRAALLRMTNGEHPTVKQAKAIGDRLGFNKDEVRRAVAMAKVHPDILDALGSDRNAVDKIKAFAKTDDHELQLNVFNTLNEEGGYWAAYQVSQALGFSGYQLRNRLEKVTRKAYTKAGGKVETNLFDDDVRVSDPALLDKLYNEAIFKEDTKLAKENSTDEIAYKALTAEEAERELWYRHYYSDTEDGYEYAIYNGNTYCREIATDEPKTDGETDNQRTTDEEPRLSKRAIDTLEPMRQATIQRTIIEDASDPDLQALCCAFTLGRAMAQPYLSSKLTGVSPSPYGTVFPDWAKEPDLTTAWNDFYNLDEPTQAQQIATIWTAMYPPSLEETFASQFAGRRTQKPIELHEDFFSIYNKREQLVAIAEEMGVEIEPKAKLKDIRSALYEHNKANDWAWTAPELRLP
jgi:ParB/RepB/Spo0J family partition protein